VTPDVATAVKNAKAGRVRFRVDKAGIVHGTIGRRSFDNDKLQGNLAALIEALVKAKPATSKGVYLRKVAVSSTMGLGVRVDAIHRHAELMCRGSRCGEILMPRCRRATGRSGGSERRSFGAPGPSKTAGVQ
jgi:hypothetical protein